MTFQWKITGVSWTKWIIVEMFYIFCTVPGGLYSIMLVQPASCEISLILTSRLISIYLKGGQQEKTWFLAFLSKCSPTWEHGHLAKATDGWSARRHLSLYSTHESAFGPGTATMIRQDIKGQCVNFNHLSFTKETGRCSIRFL